MRERPEVVVYPDAATLAREVAARLVPALAEAQYQSADRARLGLTAGSIMEKVWAALAASPTARQLDWSKIDLIWGDERFVPAGSADRNDAQANRILFDREPFSAARRFPMPASDGPYGDDLGRAAAAYDDALQEARTSAAGGTTPALDVMLLGVGPDGHCCSLFPHHPALAVTGLSVIPVRNSPKPPPRRISLSFDGLNGSEEIWVVVSGAEKAEAVAAALGGADPADIPSAGARGRKRTVWFVDADAAELLER